MKKRVILGTTGQSILLEAAIKVGTYTYWAQEINIFYAVRVTTCQISTRKKAILSL